MAIRVFSDHYGDYPYPNLTVVDPRRGAGGSGGMEYPTLITAGTHYNLPAGLRSVEMVIIHEFGHNYWYHLLASNEFEEAWMDEGINTYTEGRVFEEHYGGYVIDLLGFKLSEEQGNRVNHIVAPKSGSDLPKGLGELRPKQLCGELLFEAGTRLADAPQLPGGRRR